MLLAPGFRHSRAQINRRPVVPAIGRLQYAVIAEDAQTVIPVRMNAACNPSNRSGDEFDTANREVGSLAAGQISLVGKQYVAEADNPFRRSEERRQPSEIVPGMLQRAAGLKLVLKRPVGARLVCPSSVVLKNDIVVQLSVRPPGCSDASFA